MSTSITHLDWATLVDYWSGELTAAEEEAHEEHLFGCAECTSLSARVSALTTTLRGIIPTILTPELVAKLSARGVSFVDNPMRPGERREVVFPSHADVLLHSLNELALENATRVSFAMRVEETGAALVEVDDAAFDRKGGRILVACQKHFSVLPPNTVAEVRVHDAHGGEQVTTYTILHRF